MSREMTFDRSVTPALLEVLRNTEARGLVGRARGQGAKPLYDLQLRSAPKGVEAWATLYYGMTALINLRERKGQFKLDANEKYMALPSFSGAWSTFQPIEQITDEWQSVETYIDAVAQFVSVGSALKKEGPVHAGMASGGSDAYRIIQREARPSFLNKQVRERRLAAWVAPFNRALGEAGRDDAWWPKSVKVGSSLDFLAVDIGGRLVLLEAKADNASAGELSKVAVQAGVYATMFADLLREEGATAMDSISEMLAQRSTLGLSRRGVLHLREHGQVVPVIAIGPGDPRRTEARLSETVHERMWAVAEAVSRLRDDRIDPVEVWYLDRQGRIVDVERAEDVARSKRRR